MFSKLLACVFILSALSSVDAISCIDRQGNPVAWFSFLKFPGNLTETIPRYAYIDANSGPKYQTINGSLCDFENEALPRTFEAINKMPSKYSSKVLYNDQPPTDRYNPDGGHAKGILAYDNQTKTGVFIMHSFPQYPNLSTTEEGRILRETPNNTHKYGQSAYCISLNEESFNSVIHNLPIAQPNLYYASGIFKTMNFNGKDKLAVSQFNLLNGEEQFYLTKHAKYAGYLYEDIIAPYFKTSFATESWGRPYQPPKCATLKSLNIVQIQLNENDSWYHSMDHSKWTVTMGDDGVKLACLCDVNRMDSQRVRGGSCMCSRNPNLYQALRSLIITVDQCTEKVVA